MGLGRGCGRGLTIVVAGEHEFVPEDGIIIDVVRSASRSRLCNKRRGDDDNDDLLGDPLATLANLVPVDVHIDVHRLFLYMRRAVRIGREHGGFRGCHGRG